MEMDGRDCAKCQNWGKKGIILFQVQGEHEETAHHRDRF